MRSRLIYLTLLLLPLAVYGPVVQTEYAKLGDYGQIRSAQSVIESASTTAGSTLVYRALLESSFAIVHDVPMLAGIRLASVLLLGVLAILIWRQLDSSGWPELDGAAVGLLIVLLPSAQICAGWAQCWPRVLGLLFAIAGFAAVETELEAGGLKRVVAMFGGVLIYLVAAMIHPPILMFAMVPMAAVLLFKLRKTGQPLRKNVNWLLLHLLVLTVGTAAGRVLDHMAGGGPLFALADVKAAAIWFLLDGIPNSLALFALRDDFHTGAWYFWPAALLVLAFIYYTFKRELAAGDEAERQKLVISAGVIPGVVLVGMMLSGSPGPAGYRDLFAVSGLVVVLLITCIQSYLRTKVIKRWMHQVILAVLVLVAAAAARTHVSSLITSPQNHEWQLMGSSVAFARYKPDMKVFLVTASVGDRMTVRRYGDEFGTVSSRHAGVLKEMFMAAAMERGWQKATELNVTIGADAPPPGAYDLVVDMRKLREFRQRE